MAVGEFAIFGCLVLNPYRVGGLGFLSTHLCRNKGTNRNANVTLTKKMGDNENVIQPRRRPPPQPSKN